MGLTSTKRVATGTFCCCSGVQAVVGGDSAPWLDILSCRIGLCQPLLLASRGHCTAPSGQKPARSNPKAACGRLVLVSLAAMTTVADAPASFTPGAAEIRQKLLYLEVHV